MPHHTEENIEKLARDVVDSWDMDTLLTYAIQKLEENYKEDKDLFIEDWNSMNRGGGKEIIEKG